MGLSLSEIRELLDLYDENDDGAAQMARSLKKFRERATALEQQREDIDGALIELREACSASSGAWPRSAPTCCPAPPTTTRCCAPGSTVMATQHWASRPDSAFFLQDRGEARSHLPFL